MESQVSTEEENFSGEEFQVIKTFHKNVGNKLKLNKKILVENHEQFNKELKALVSEHEEQLIEAKTGLDLSLQNWDKFNKIKKAAKRPEPKILTENLKASSKLNLEKYDEILAQFKESFYQFSDKLNGEEVLSLNPTEDEDNKFDI